MKISLIVSTYNWPKALSLCLDSIRRQTRMPDEVIIADDGSGEATKDLIARESKTFPCPLYHFWIPDMGFRKALAHNKALLTYCTGDYLVFIDQDIILDPRFIADHERIAQRGYFVCGGRSSLGKDVSRSLLDGENVHLGLDTPDLKRKINTIHAPWLHFLTKYIYSWKPLYGRGANMAMWTDDLKRVNGFDEAIMGYGGEDVDLFNRLLNSGVKKKYAQFCAIEYHIWHRRKKVPSNKEISLFAIPNYYYCTHGLYHKAASL